MTPGPRNARGPRNDTRAGGSVPHLLGRRRRHAGSEQLASDGDRGQRRGATRLPLPARGEYRHGGDDVRRSVWPGERGGGQPHSVAGAELGRRRLPAVAGLEDRDGGGRDRGGGGQAGWFYRGGGLPVGQPEVVAGLRQRRRDVSSRRLRQRVGPGDGARRTAAAGFAAMPPAAAPVRGTPT